MNNLMKPRSVLQVGDIAGVAATLAHGLRQYTAWSVDEVALPPPTADGKFAKALEIPKRGLDARRLVRSAVKAQQPSLLHVHWARYAPFIGAQPCPTIIHAHGSDVRGRAGSVSGRVVLRALGRARAVLVSTPDLLDDVGPNATYLPNPIDTNVFAPADTAKLAPTNERPTVFVFSQLIEVKGAKTLLAAARLMKAQAPDLRIIALSGGTYDNEARDCGIEMLPRQTRVQLAALLAQVDVVVGQLILGSLGLSELEAMACAKPVVAYVREGLYVRDVPVVSARTAEQVAQECASLIADAACARTLGQRARDYVLETHDTEVVVAQLASIYEGLL